MSDGEKKENGKGYKEQMQNKLQDATAKGF